MLRRFSFALVPSALLALAACDSTGTGGSGGTGNQGGNGGSGNQGNDGGSGGILFGGQGGFGGQQQAALNIAPVNPTLNVLYGLAGPTVQFTATDINGQAVNPVWSLDTPEAGTISANGLFTANGVGAGEVQVYAKLGDQQAQTTLTIIMTATENPANLGAGEVAVLQGGGGGSDPNFVLWYPYDNTIFPRGILSPQWQLSTNEIQPTAYYVRMSSPTFTYDGFLPPLAGQKRFQIGQGIWDAAGSALGGAPVTVEISKLVNGQKYGPITRTVRIAKGKLKGTVYYNTYDNVGAGSGAIMRIKGTDVAPTIHIGNCTVCHSVASDGSTGAAANHSGPGGVFDFLNGNALTWQTPELTAFGALYPKNGEVILIQGAPGGSWPPNTPGTSGNWTSSLYTKNGAQIPSSGIEGYYAQTPVFSHDGKHVAFYDRPAGGGTGNLVMMDYDELTQKFTNYQVLVAGIGGEHLSWPAFTPDGKWVVYQRGVGDDLATWSANTGKLWAVNVVTKVATELANVNGDAYVPQGARDINLNYEPTILPIASGGYFWLMFTSRRTYGNTLLADRYSTKRLWVAALDLNGQDGVDFSHPGFYVQGQDLNSGNSRGFWALDPCKSDGQGCESGDECCNGFCNPSDADPNVFVCGQPTGSCSHEFESCVTAADCCDASSLCINGKCSQPPPN